uniref:Uncharacterized protein n=1 Tax=Anguilla anguilla TaxID=7936 RepID=A0A0E9P9C6_ANGAN
MQRRGLEESGQRRGRLLVRHGVTH